MVAEIEDHILLNDDILRRDPEGPMDILTTEKVMVFKGIQIPLHTVGEQKQKIMVLAVNTLVLPGMTEQIVDGYLDQSKEHEGAEQCMLVEPDPGFKQRYGYMVVPAVVDMAGRTTTRVRVFNPYAEPVTRHGNVVKASMEETVVKRVLMNEESPLDRYNSQPTRWVVLEKELPNGGPKYRVGQMECVEELPVPPYLQTLFEKAAVKQNKAEQRAISRLLNSFHDVFSRDEFDLSKMHLVEHHIETGDAVPVKLPPRCIPLAFGDEDCRELEKLKRRGVIKPSTSPWAAPLVMVRIHCGVPRMCLDYRRLNAVTKDVAYSIPHTQDCLDAVAGATLFSTMDITAAYHQIPVAKEDIPKMAFITKYGLYEFITMPFGLKTAPQTYQRLMELALSGLQWTACLIYLDDVIVYGKTFEKHLQRLSLVFQRFRQEGLKLKPGKCHFFETQVTFLGHVLTLDGVLPDPGNVEKITTWPVPTCVTDVRAVLGMGNYYWGFIKDYSKKMQPLIQLTKKDKSFGGQLSARGHSTG